MAALFLGRRQMMVGAMLLAAGCAKPSGAKPVRIGYQRSGVLLLARSRGRVDAALAATGSRIEWVEFAAGPPMMEAIAAGAIDFGSVGDAPPIFAQAGSAPILYVASQPVTGAASALLLPKTSTIQSVAELRGRKVAFTKASSAHIFVYQALKQAGLALVDVQPVYLSPGDAASAFGSGEMDAWATWDPYNALAVRDQQARVLLTGETLPRTSNFYIAAKTFAQSRPAVLRTLLDALRAEAAWGRANEAEVAKVVNAATGLPVDIVTTSLRHGRIAVEPLTDAAIAGQQAAADAVRAIGAIPQRVDVRSAAWRRWTPKVGAD